MSGNENSKKPKRVKPKMPPELERELKSLEGRDPKDYRRMSLSTISGLAVEMDPIGEMTFTESLTSELMQIVNEVKPLSRSEYLAIELRMKRLINRL